MHGADRHRSAHCVRQRLPVQLARERLLRKHARKSLAWAVVGARAHKVCHAAVEHEARLGHAAERLDARGERIALRGCVSRAAQLRTRVDAGKRHMQPL